MVTVFHSSIVVSSINVILVAALVKFDLAE